MTDEFPNTTVVYFTSWLCLSSRIFKLIIQSHFCASGMQRSCNSLPFAHLLPMRPSSISTKLEHPANHLTGKIER
jgi:hypothetical protein